MKPVQRQLAKLFADGAVIPFIGAGLSVGSGLPTWKELLEVLAAELLGHMDIFGQDYDFLRVAEYLVQVAPGGHSQVAGIIEREFRKRVVHVAQSDPHLLLGALNAPVMYTTNYDSLLEEALLYLGIECQKVVSLDDIIVASHNTRPQVVKFHGSLEKPDSIVLREETFFRRLDFETPLDIKLRADILGKSVLFLGYSFSDINIRYMFYKLRRLAQASERDTLPARSYIVLLERDEVQDTLLHRYGLTPIYLSDYDGCDGTAKMTDFLQGIVTLASETSGRVKQVLTNTVVKSVDRAILDDDWALLEKALGSLGDATIGSAQFIPFLYGVCQDGYDRWARVFDLGTSQVRRTAARFLRCTLAQRDEQWISEVLATACLRYPEAREELGATMALPDVYYDKWCHSDRVKERTTADAAYWIAHGPADGNASAWLVAGLVAWRDEDVQVRTILGRLCDTFRLPNVTTEQFRKIDVGPLTCLLGLRDLGPNEFPWPAWSGKRIPKEPTTRLG